MKKETLCKDKISVIIPIYNVEKYIKTCVDSVCSQTYGNLEIVLIDDGSTDSCAEICDQYKDSDERVVVLHQKNGGQSVARNAGLEVATGDYIAFVDGDDWIEKDYLEKLHHACASQNTLLAGCKYHKAHVLGEGSRFQEVVEKDIKRLSIDEVMEAYIKETEEPMIYHSPWGKIYAKELLQKVRFEVGKKSEDIVFVTQVFEQIEAMAYVSEALYDYNVIREGSAMFMKNSNHTFEHEIPNWKQQFSIMRENSRLKKWADVAEFYFYWRMISYEKQYRKSETTKTEASQMKSFLRGEHAEMKRVCKIQGVDLKKAFRLKLYCANTEVYWLVDGLLDKRSER